MNKKIITGVALCGMVAGLAQGATLCFRGNGSWDMLEGVGQPEGWQSAVPPGAADTVRANWGGATVTLDYATTVQHAQLGVDESGTFHMLAGGALTVTGNIKVGNNGDPIIDGDVGILNIDAGGSASSGSWMGLGHGTDGIVSVSGTLTCNSHLWMGASNADATGWLTVENGGVVNVLGNLGMGTIAPGDLTNTKGTALITVNSGGLLSLAYWDNDGSIRDGSVMTINDGGSVVIGGNRVDSANAWATAGKLTSDLGTVEAVYTADGNFTTLTAVIPEPATLGLFAAFGGAVLFIRRRFKI